MSSQLALDLQAEYEPLVIQASNLGIRAKAHEAKGEPFEAAILWAQAGRIHSELGGKLINNQQLEAGVRDLLYSAGCFLEARDPRLAKEQLAKLHDARLLEVVSSNPALEADTAQCARQCEGLDRALSRAWRDLEAGMREGALYRPGLVKPKLVADVLKRFPGVANLHWIAGQSRGYRKQYADAALHYRWCLRLRPSDQIVQATLIACLALAEKWDELDAETASALADFPESSVVLFFVGWSILCRVHQRAAPKTRLHEALGHLQRASALPPITPTQRRELNLCIAYCHFLMGEQQQARDLVAKIVHEGSVAFDIYMSLRPDLPENQLERSLSGEVQRIAAAQVAA